MSVNEINLPPSLIILKNSIIEGRVPKSNDLEVGEIALGLFGGKESIWSKNSEGNIVDLRSPRHDLFWSDLFIKYDTLAQFEKDLEKGLIKDTSIVFIKDTLQIWSDGVYYASCYSEDELERIVASKILSIPGAVYNLNNSSTSNDITEAFGSINGFKDIVNKSIENGSLSYIKLPEGGSIPVSVSPRVLSLTESELKLEWVESGQYITLTISLVNSVFTVTRDALNFSRFLEIEKNVGTLLDFNKPLVSPQIIGNWIFYNQSEEEVSINGVNKNNPHLEEGYKVKFKGSYKWESLKGCKNPEIVVEGSNWSDLPGDGVLSSEFESDFITSDTEISITLSSAKTGLKVSGIDVVPNDGYDFSSDKRMVTFAGKEYYGLITKDSSEITPSDILGLESSDIITNNKKFENISLGETEYFIYAYPQRFGEVNYIMQNGVIPVFGAFNMRKIDIVNSAGATVNLYVYTTNNPGAFTDSSVEFK